MITDVVLTIAVVLFVWCLSFMSVMFLLLSGMDYKTKNRYSVMVLGVLVLVLIVYITYIFFV